MRVAPPLRGGHGRSNRLEHKRRVVWFRVCVPDGSVARAAGRLCRPARDAHSARGVRVCLFLRLRVSVSVSPCLRVSVVQLLVAERQAASDMKSIVVGTAGHIDHGKSALVRALTGIDPDRLKEEQARGITIDLGFAHQVIGGTNFAFVDVPGHERFVKNMLAGVGGIDLVVLVVAADESVMPQTREHFDICRLLHIPTGLVALTKVDLADADTLELARLEVRELVAESFLDGAPIVPVSVRTGDGLEALRTALVDIGRAVASRAAHGTTRLPIDRVFSMKGFGTVVTGTLVSGRIAVDDELAIEPGGRRAKVRGVQVHGEKRREAIAGERSAVNLAGVEVDEISRGEALVAPGAFEPTRLADATLDLLPGTK